MSDTSYVEIDSITNDINYLNDIMNQPTENAQTQNSNFSPIPSHRPQVSRNCTPIPHNYPTNSRNFAPSLPYPQIPQIHHPIPSYPPILPNYNNYVPNFLSTHLQNIFYSAQISNNNIPILVPSSNPDSPATTTTYTPPPINSPPQTNTRPHQISQIENRRETYSLPPGPELPIEPYSYVPIVLKSVMYARFEGIIDDNFFELYLLAKRAHESNEQGLFQYIKEFINDLKYLRVTMPGIAHETKYPRDCTIFVSKLIGTTGDDNKLTEIELINIPTYINIRFPQQIKPSILLCKKISFTNFYINPVNIHTLKLIQIKNYLDRVPKLLLACQKLKSLSIENFDSLIFNMHLLRNLKLVKLKLLGSSFRQDFPEKISAFIIKQAPTLEKLSIKIKNKRDLIYNLEVEGTKFPLLRKLTFFTSDTNMSNMPREFLYNLVTLKIGTTVCHSYTCILHLRQLDSFPNVKNIKILYYSTTLNLQQISDILTIYKHDKNISLLQSSEQ